MDEENEMGDPMSEEVQRELLHDIEVYKIEIERKKALIGVPLRGYMACLYSITPHMAVESFGETVEEAMRLAINEYCCNHPKKYLSMALGSGATYFNFYAITAGPSHRCISSEMYHAAWAQVRSE